MRISFFLVCACVCMGGEGGGGVICVLDADKECVWMMCGFGIAFF